MTVSHLFSNWISEMKPNAIRAVVNRSAGPEFVSFTAGKPAPSLFPIERLKEKATAVLDEYGGDALQYFGTQGHPPLRDYLAQRFESSTPDDVLIISGSQQGIDLAGKLFVNPGDKVATAAPTFPGALSAMRVHEPEIIGVACDHEGMLPDALEAVLKQGVKFIYCIPNFMNPTGVSMSLERRQATVALAQQYQVPVIEDDPYGDLRYEGEPLPSLFDLAPEQVLYLGTFSKIFAPGFRLAWAVAKPEIMKPLMIAKQSADLQSATFSQFLVYESLKDGFLEGRIEEIRKYYHQQRNHMLEAINQAFPDSVRYNVPSGGMFLWCELPEGKDASEILETALEHKVAYVPGRPFFPGSWQGGENTLRLSFSLVAPEEINEGIDRLGQVFKTVL